MSVIKIPVKSVGDHWSNRSEFMRMLYNSNLLDLIVLDIRFEGPSLVVLGVVDAVLDYVNKSGKQLDLVQVTSWTNSVECVPFKRVESPRISHFWEMSKSYSSAVPLHRTAEYVLGYFVGRRTIPRCAKLKDVSQCYGDYFLTSMLRDQPNALFSPLDQLEHWCDPEEFCSWYKTVDIPSLDTFSMEDQYNPLYNTQVSLLNWYPKFDIELVSETNCHGDCFFPTEKTIRPIVAGKSMLVYGPKNYLARLKQLGFQTWHQIWDESYDLFTGPERWQKMKKVLDHIVQQDQTQLYQQCLPIVQHNQQHVARLIQNTNSGKLVTSSC
jgi:hypothetical protein